MPPKTFLRCFILLGTPLSLTAPMLFHPSPYDDAGELVPIARLRTRLHTAQFVLFAPMGWAVWALVEGLSGIAAAVSRVAAAVFVPFYDVGNAVAGIATGILTSSIAGAPTGERTGLVAAIFADGTENLASAVGIYAWVLALVVAGVALRHTGAPLAPVLPLALPAFLIAFDHAFPFGSLTFASFFLVVLWLELRWHGRGSSDTGAGPGAPRLANTEPV